MSVELPIVSTIEAAHRDAIDEVNRWRGHCIELFARIEKTLVDALEKKGGATTPALLPRIATVSALPGLKPKLRAKLEELRGLAEDRNLIVHSTSAVWIDANGDWLWTYTFTPAGKAKTPLIGHWDQERARAFETRLSSIEKSLRAQLLPR